MGRNSVKKTPQKTPQDEGKKYVVEKVLGKRYSRTKLQYLIKWKGYNNSENSWEPAVNCECYDLIEKYENEQQSKVRGKKRGASTGASSNVGPSAKRSRTSAPQNSNPRVLRNRSSVPAATLRNRRDSSEPSYQSDSSSSSVEIVEPKKTNRRNRSTAPKLVNQQASFAFASSGSSSAPNNNNTSDEIHGIETNNTSSSASVRIIEPKKIRRNKAKPDAPRQASVEILSPGSPNNSTTSPNTNTSGEIQDTETNNADLSNVSPDAEPVVDIAYGDSIVQNNNEYVLVDNALTPHAGDDAAIYFKKIESADKNLKMAEELLKIPDLFYVITSLEILKDKLRKNRQKLLTVLEHHAVKGGEDADKLAQITAKVEEVKTIHDEIETALHNLHPSSQLGQHDSPPPTTPPPDLEVKNETPTTDETVVTVTDTVKVKIMLDAAHTPQKEPTTGNALEDVIVADVLIPKADIEEGEMTLNNPEGEPDVIQVEEDVVVETVPQPTDDVVILDAEDTPQSEADVTQVEEDVAAESVPDAADDVVILDVEDTPQNETAVNPVEEEAIGDKSDPILVADGTLNNVDNASGSLPEFDNTENLGAESRKTVGDESQSNDNDEEVKEL